MIFATPWEQEVFQRLNLIKVIPKIVTFFSVIFYKFLTINVFLIGTHKHPSNFILTFLDIVIICIKIMVFWDIFLDFQEFFRKNFYQFVHYYTELNVVSFVVSKKNTLYQRKYNLKKIWVRHWLLFDWTWHNNKYIAPNKNQCNSENLLNSIKLIKIYLYY